MGKWFGTSAERFSRLEGFGDPVISMCLVWTPDSLCNASVSKNPSREA